MPGPEQPEPTTPRTWLPLVVAASIAALVVIGAFVASSLRSGMSAGRSDAVRACEEAYEASAEDGEVLPRIVAGDVYGSAEWRDLRDFLEAQGLLESAGVEVDGSEADASAAALAEQGRDHVTVVWWLDSEEHLACEVDVEGDSALDGTAVLVPLS
ncbi:hypothetical protein [Demequina rhizosphaerae]|uniref:hypothetical protein n=1 Tax=Demequina rhizosphaerae TaxID=1638985 RepID=UPI00078224B1|nr:hypothetical protein [Demequina rhizosphaerae]